MIRGRCNMGLFPLRALMTVWSFMQFIPAFWSNSGLTEEYLSEWLNIHFSPFFTRWWENKNEGEFTTVFLKVCFWSCLGLVCTEQASVLNLSSISTVMKRKLTSLFTHHVLLQGLSPQVSTQWLMGWTSGFTDVIANESSGNGIDLVARLSKCIEMFPYLRAF